MPDIVIHAVAAAAYAALAWHFWKTRWRARRNDAPAGLAGWERAALAGVTAGQVTQATSALLGGHDIGLLRAPDEPEPVPIRVQLSVAERADLLSMFTLFFDDPERLNREMDMIRAVTPADVRSVAERWLGPDNRAVLAYEPAA